jgi:hypothetical protein
MTQPHLAPTVAAAADGGTLARRRDIDLDVTYSTWTTAAE